MFYFFYYVFIDYHTLSVLSCPDVLCWVLDFMVFLSLIVFDVFLCKAFVWYNLINQIKIKCLIKNKIIKTAVSKTIPNHTAWLKNWGTYRSVTFVYRYTPSWDPPWETTACIKGDILHHQVWVWLAITSRFEIWACPPWCALDRSVHQPTPWSVANGAHLSVTQLGGHVHLWCQKRQISKTARNG